ncbi:MAG TPA: ketosamine-3-kinase [Cryomorphaceae bacterium]|nr:ketosamine-3-kinase [Owenweeksia sp.]MBF98784.1 ketosamine-3-kinase [Owenweeksia sp.]HAD98630.1 ketosamine-3-kinase [Cryomorphaceae bacterium]HBF20488.1 ketosamine-3-kinase [Cryomorphaceae bacterium]
MTSMSALSPNIYSYLLEQLQPLVEGLQTIHKAVPVSGGDINEAYRLDTDVGPLFLKKNHARKFPAMFEKEASGIELLARPGVIRLPKVIWWGEVAEEAFLVLEFIESATPDSDFTERFGSQLAALHAVKGPYFGLDHDNYIGSLHQANRPTNSWAEFFVEERLEPQFEKAFNAGYFHSSQRREMQRLFEKLDIIFPEEKPALVHGDLWGGNYLTSTKGEPVLIDPAVYYGHREMDIAMMHLFGGFHKEVFYYYHQQYPLMEGWQRRTDLCNMYPLLVHVNLFGGSYAQQLIHSLKYFV